MSDIEYFARGKETSSKDIKKDVFYYVLEYFLAKEYMEKDPRVYLDYILPKFESDTGIKFSKEVYEQDEIFEYDEIAFSFMRNDTSKIPLDMYQENYVEYILKKYNNEIGEILERLEFLASLNSSLYRTVEFYFLEDKYFNDIPCDIYLTLCSFPKVQYLLSQMQDTNYEVFLNTIKKMTEIYSNMDIITNLILIVTACEQEVFKEEDVNNIDYDLFINIIFNDFSIHSDLGIPKKNADIFNYYKNQTKEKILSSNKAELIDAVLILKYGLTLREIKRIFANVNKLLGNYDSDFSNFYKEVLELLKMSEEDLRLFYTNISTTSLKNYYMCKKYVKNLILQKYNESLFKMDKDIVEYELEDDFNMIIHITGAFSINDCENYSESWNREEANSLWMSCSYISNELICTAPFREKSVCYGFSSMEDDSLLYYGTEDLESETNSIEQRWLVSDPDNILPNDIINNTNMHSESHGYYNELNFARVQNQKKKNPDYIIMFRNDGNYINETLSRKAQKDFGNIPIVVVDVDKMLRKSEIKFNLLKTEFDKTKDENILREMYHIASNCYKTCYNWNKTNNYFLSDTCQNFMNYYKEHYIEVFTRKYPNK